MGNAFSGIQNNSGREQEDQPSGNPGDENSGNLERSGDQNQGRRIEPNSRTNRDNSRYRQALSRHPYLNQPGNVSQNHSINDMLDILRETALNQPASNQRNLARDRQPPVHFPRPTAEDLERMRPGQPRRFDPTNVPEILRGSGEAAENAGPNPTPVSPFSFGTGRPGEGTGGLSRILSLAANAISLTAQEHHQRIDQPSQPDAIHSVRTASSFMDSFLRHLHDLSASSQDPLPSLSLVSETTSNDNSGAVSHFRIFRMHEPGTNTEGETAPPNFPPTPETDSNHGDIGSHAPLSGSSRTAASHSNVQTPAANIDPTNPNAHVPVLVIGIRSVNNTDQPPRRSSRTQNYVPDEIPTYEPANSTSTPQLSTTPSSLQPDLPTQTLNSTPDAIDSTIPPDDAASGAETTPARRSWIIYVIGSNYPPNHPFLTQGLSENPTYEELLNLSAFLGPARPPTTNQAAIDEQLKEIVFSDSLPVKTGIAILNGSRCQVCLTDYEENDLLRLLKCQHAFHTQCIDKWLTTGSNHCPVCRREATDRGDFKSDSPENGPSRQGSSLVDLVNHTR